jgi:hypothetical protein
MHYAGNIATNTTDGTPLAFSSTLRGYLWNSDGTTNVYDNGEVVATHPVNRVLGIIREGYYASDTNALALDANYFKNHMPMQVTARFYMQNGSSGSRTLSTAPWLDEIGYTDGGFGLTQLEGQRQLGMTYSLQGTTALNDPLNPDNGISWTNLVTGILDGYVYTGTYLPNGFFRAREGNVILPSALLPSLRTVQVTESAPSIKVSNGPE